MDNSNKTIRILSFLGVLILSGALLTGLFQEARGDVDMSWETAPSSASGNQEFTFQLVIPDGDLVPIESIDAVLEKQNPDFDNKAGALFVSRASCPMNPGSGMDCTPNAASPNALSLVQGDAGVITQIQLDRVFQQSTGTEMTTGYSDQCANGPNSRCEFTTSGYGYDGAFTGAPGIVSSNLYSQAGYGYGYGYDVGRGTDASASSVTSGTGYGYVAGGTDSVVFEFTITVNADQLDSGTTYYLSGLVETRSTVIGHFTTPWTSFTAGGGGGTPSGPNAPGGGSGAQNLVDEGASFDGTSGQTWTVTDGLPSSVREVELTLDQDCTDCSIHVTRSTSAPSGAPGLSVGFDGLYYLTIELRDSNGNVVSGGVSSGSVSFDVDASDLGDNTPQQVLLLRDDNGWSPLTTSLTSSDTADPLEYQATLPGFSTFAVVMDTEAPSITDPQPTGSTTAVTPNIGASFEDNRGIDTNSLELTIDGVQASDTTGSLTVTGDDFTYVPAQSLSQGEHTVEATIQDESGLETTRTWSFQVSDVTCEDPPRITTLSPSSGASEIAPGSEIRVTIQEGSCPIDTSSLTVNGDEVAATLSGGVLSATLPDTVGENQQVNATVTVTDTGDNTAERSWSFTTGEADAGIGALVWILIALIVVAIIGVGAYFYTEQQNGGASQDHGPGGP